MQFNDYSRNAKSLRALIKEEFASTSPSRWRYRYTDLLPICEVRGLNDRPPPPNAVAYVSFNSKYCSSENPGWRPHSEHVYLTDVGTFISDGYDRVLTAVLPTWLKSIA
jgi:hypothetical protein